MQTVTRKAVLQALARKQVKAANKRALRKLFQHHLSHLHKQLELLDNYNTTD